MAVGLISSIWFGYYYQFVEKLPMHFSIYALALAILAMVVVSLLTQKNSDAALDETYTSAYHPKELSK